MESEVRCEHIEEFLLKKFPTCAGIKSSSSFFIEELKINSNS